MIEEDTIRKILLRFPSKKEIVRVFIEPSLSCFDKGWINSLNSYFKEVNTPEEADFIPLVIPYMGEIKSETKKLIEQFSNKCISSFNLAESINVELEEIDDNNLKNIEELLSSLDSESFNLGLCLARTFYLTEEAKRIIKVCLSSFKQDCSGSGTITPLFAKNTTRITIEDITVIRYFYMWLNNEII